MFLITMWILMIIFTGYTKMRYMDSLTYFSIALITFYLTWLDNIIKPKNMTLRTIVIFVSIPSIIFWFIADRYNFFLSLNPINEIIFNITQILYFYILVYIISEYDINNTKKSF